MGNNGTVLERPPAQSVRLNIGGGDTDLPGFACHDIRDGNSALALEYLDNSVDEIRASHVLEHLSFADAQRALREWSRVLKPGARLRVAVPDFSKINPSDPLWRFYLMGGQIHEHDFHRSCWRRSDLETEMSAAGFSGIREWEDDGIDTASNPVSLRLEGVKATESQSQQITIRAVCSMPRIGWNDAWACFQSSFRPFGIPVVTFTGAYWGQCIQNCLEDAIHDGIDWVFTLDYDTLFTARDVDALLGHMGRNPQIDAIAALQCRRHADFPLLTLAGHKRQCEMDGTPLPVETAHFGLTLIRMESLKDLPKPWFISQPSKSGSWRDDDRVDDDIYFWNQWHKHGRTIYVAPDVRVGHLELMVSIFDEHLKPQRMQINEWNEKHGYRRKKGATK